LPVYIQLIKRKGWGFGTSSTPPVTLLSRAAPSQDLVKDPSAYIVVFVFCSIVQYFEMWDICCFDDFGWTAVHHCLINVREYQSRNQKRTVQRNWGKNIKQNEKHKTNINNVKKHALFYKQLEVKTNRTSLRTSQHGIQSVKTHNRTTQKIQKISNTDPTKNPRGELRRLWMISSSCFL
jgi:hypothetical protein